MTLFSSALLFVLLLSAETLYAQLPAGRLAMWVRADSGVTLAPANRTAPGLYDTLVVFRPDGTVADRRTYAGDSLPPNRVLYWRNLAAATPAGVTEPGIVNRVLRVPAFRDSADFQRKDDGFNNNNRGLLVTNAINSRPAVRFRGPVVLNDSTATYDEYNGMFSEVPSGRGFNDSITAFVVAANLTPDSLLNRTVFGFAGGIDVVVASKPNGPNTTGFVMTTSNRFTNPNQRGVFTEAGGPGSVVEMRKNGSGNPLGLNRNEFAIMTYRGRNIRASSNGIDTVTDFRRNIILGVYPTNNFPGNNDIAELIVYNRFLPIAEVRQVEQYLSTRYNIALLSVRDDFRPKPGEFSLAQNYPNPFNPSTTIRFNMARTGQVSLEVFDLLGRKVASLVNGTRQVGVNEVRFDASALTTGVYFYRIQAGEFVETRKMMLVK
jgi:hypothetical protein